MDGMPCPLHALSTASFPVTSSAAPGNMWKCMLTRGSPRVRGLWPHIAHPDTVTEPTDLQSSFAMMLSRVAPPWTNHRGTTQRRCTYAQSPFVGGPDDLTHALVSQEVAEEQRQLAAPLPQLLPSAQPRVGKAPPGSDSTRAELGSIVGVHQCDPGALAPVRPRRAALNCRPL